MLFLENQSPQSVWSPVCLLPCTLVNLHNDKVARQSAYQPSIDKDSLWVLTLQARSRLSLLNTSNKWSHKNWQESSVSLSLYLCAIGPPRFIHGHSSNRPRRRYQTLTCHLFPLFPSFSFSLPHTLAHTQARLCAHTHVRACTYTLFPQRELAWCWRLVGVCMVLINVSVVVFLTATSIYSWEKLKIS